MNRSQQTHDIYRICNRNPFERFIYAVGAYFAGVGLLIWHTIRAIPGFFAGIGIKIGRDFMGLWQRFVKGGIWVKLSYLIMGTGCFSVGQIVKGTLYLLAEVGYILFTIFVAWDSILKIPSLGYVEDKFVYINGLQYSIPGDVSRNILMYFMLWLFLTIAFVRFYINNTKTAYNNEQTKKHGKPVTKFKQQLHHALNDDYHVTILLLPVLGIIFISIIPTICNVLIAFTDYNLYEKSSTTNFNLFSWDLKAFGSLFSSASGGNFGDTFLRLLSWTLIWAACATFLNYFFGMILALMINKKTIRFKRLWRTIFVMTIAVPQFVTLLMMSQFLSRYGIVNRTLQNWGLIDVLHRWGWLEARFDYVPFFQKQLLARVTVIVVNLWIGIPYTMLITTGILMNIPAELYESAKIDGAGIARTFFSITLPYMLFVTGPYLITQFMGNMNNFNVIYLLSRGDPVMPEYAHGAGGTDLLITWLYKISVDRQSYNVGSVVGIVMFLITAFFTLILFNSSAAVKKEESFQ